MSLDVLYFGICFTDGTDTCIRGFTRPTEQEIKETLLCTSHERKEVQGICQITLKEATEFYNELLDLKEVI